VSLMRNSRLPATWQTLLTDQVTCCSSSIRTSPAQIRAVSAPAQDHDSSPPSRAGPSRLTPTHSGNRASTRTITRSASRSGAYRALLVPSASKNQPT